MDTVRKPSILTGALVGLLLTAPLMAIFYLADQLAGLPFVPFDFFDWFGRQLPGDLITNVIDVMVDAIIAFNLGETSSTAKTIEQMMGLGIMLGIGIVIGALLFFAFRRMNQVFALGIGAGAVVGIIMALISREVNLTATADPLLQTVWVIAAFAAWGAGFAWIYGDLARLATKREATASQLNRREFLVRMGGAAATITVLGTGLSLLLREPDTTEESFEVASSTEGGGNAQLPNANADLEPAPGTRLEYTPVEDHYRIDISSRPPVIDEQEWTLNVTGLVAAPVAMTLAELRENYEPVDQFVTLSCISNRIAGDLISTTRWTGVPLHILLDEWNLDDNATHLRITSADNFDEYVSIDLIREDPRIMLTYAWDGRPLPRANGFPLRIYIPDRYGMKQPKWITDIEVVPEWGEGYWVRRGWSEEALVNTTSVIDTVATDAAYEMDGTTFIPIGGIAYSGAKQISRVEVSVNEGEWVEAQLREPLSDLTWVIWRYDWPFEAGTHTFAVRCYDGDGNLQITSSRGVRPDGATGVHTEREHIPEVSI